MRDYLKRRGFGIEIARAWQLGWAPQDFREFAQVAQSRSMDDRLLTEAYLLGRGQRGLYPVFRDRLMFPIHNVRGEVVGFSGRIIQEGQDPRKYVNTADTAAFHKGELLFGLYKATGPIGKAGMCVVVCEGQLDVIACHEKADIRNAVAGLGTAFTDEHAKILRKYAKKAILCYDGDNAGIKASEKTFRKLAAAGLEVYHASLPPGEDPDSLIGHSGPEALRQAIDTARPYLEVRVGQELAMIQGDANARAALIPRMADLAAEITDRNRRDVAVADLATRLNTGLEALRETVEGIIRTRKDSPQPAAAPAWEPGEEEAFDAAADETAQEAPVRVIPITLHHAIRDTIFLAAVNAEAQAMLLERIEELQEPIRWLTGGIVLQSFMESLPAPGNDAAWQEFTAKLPPEQAAALRDMQHHPIDIPDVSGTVESTCSNAALAALRAHVDQLRSRVNTPGISWQDAAPLMQEMNELQKLINAAE